MTNEEFICKAIDQITKNADVSQAHPCCRSRDYDTLYAAGLTVECAYAALEEAYKIKEDWDEWNVEPGDPPTTLEEVFDEALGEAWEKYAEIAADRWIDSHWGL